MIYLIYLSTSVNLLTDQDIQSLLAKSRAKNAQSNVTGVLLYHDGNFIQVLEGDEDDVDATFARISNDDAHKDIIIIDEGDLQQRNFGDWSMGFKRATAREFAEIEGYTDPMKLKGRAGTEDHPALSMLKTFVTTNIR